MRPWWWLAIKSLRILFLRYKTIKLGIGSDRDENVLWCVNNIKLPKFVKTVLTHCGTNNIDINNSDEMRLGIFAIARSLTHRHPNIKVLVTGLLLSVIHCSIRRVKVKKNQRLSESLLPKIYQNNFHEPRQRLGFATQLFKHATLK